LARAWAKAAHHRNGILVTADMKEDCAGMYEGDLKATLPALDSPRFKSALLDLCLSHQIAVAVPTRDDEVLEFSLMKEEFAARGIRLLAPSFDTVRLCQDKIHFSRWCGEHGFLTPPELETKLPLFARFRRGNGGSLTAKIHNAQDLEKVKRMWGSDCLIQAFVRAPEYSIDTFSDQYGKVICAVPRQRVQIVGGESWVSKTVANPALQAEAVRLAERLHLTGHAVMQCFLTVDGPLWIEVNPRFGGATSLALEAGCTSPEWILAEMAGDILPEPLAPYEDNLTMLRYSQDRFVRGA
jgi:carbamoyl-phosphate synthase large subunit